MSKITEFREMSDEQLAASLRETCTTLFRLRVQAQTERLDVPSELRRHRRTIARIKTIQRERLGKGAAAKAAIIK
jgi:large subunit ribosomal protein L29